MSDQLTLLSLPEHTPARDAVRILRAMRKKAGAEFQGRAEAYMLTLLATGASLSGEALTRACREAGILPPNGDDRYFGAVFRALSQRGAIRQVGWCARTRGHGTGGGRVWRAA